jgi:hypothetical protein
MTAFDTGTPRLQAALAQYSLPKTVSANNINLVISLKLRQTLDET